MAGESWRGSRPDVLIYSTSLPASLDSNLTRWPHAVLQWGEKSIIRETVDRTP